MHAQSKMFSLITILLIGWIEGLMMLHATNRPRAASLTQDTWTVVELVTAVIIAMLAQSWQWLTRQQRWISWAAFLWVMGIAVTNISTHLGLGSSRTVQLTACAPLVLIWLTKWDVTRLTRRRDLVVVWPGAMLIAQALALFSRLWPMSTEIITIAFMAVIACLLCWPKQLISPRTHPSNFSYPNHWHRGVVLLILGYAVSAGLRLVPSGSLLSGLDLAILAILSIVIPVFLSFLPNYQLHDRSAFFVAALIIWDLLADFEPTVHVVTLVLSLSMFLAINVVLLSQFVLTISAQSQRQKSWTSWFAPPIFMAGWGIGCIPSVHHYAPIMLTIALLALFVSTPTSARNENGPSNPVTISSRPKEDLYSRLTPQERRIVGLLVDGYSNQDIIKELYVSINTLKTHLKNIYRKTQTKNRHELVDRLTHPDPLGPHEHRRIH